jgi:hypothetical protein
MRWLHIYLSMLSLAVVLFFSVTGLTLNHPDLFSAAQRRVTAHGQLDRKWLRLDAPGTATEADADDSRRVAKLEVVEYLRKTHAIHAALAEFRVDQTECTVTFKGPGYAADAFINRDTGQYEVAQTLYGFVAVINDLHKGRDMGRAWSALIDVAAIAMIAISLTGLVLLLYLRRRRISGLMVAVVGTGVLAATAVFLVQ